MGRDCLWQVQAADYQVVYVAHYIGLAWCAVSWVYDAVQLPGWLRKSNAKQPLNVCYSTWPLISPAYLVLLGIAVMWVTLTWAAFVDWNTNNNGLTRFVPSCRSLNYLARRCPNLSPDQACAVPHPGDCVVGVGCLWSPSRMAREIIP